MRRLWFPLLLLAVFITTAIYESRMIAVLGPDAPPRTTLALKYILAIGLWASGALALNRILHVFVWDGLAHRMLGAPVPRLIRDVVALVLLFLAVTGIVSFVFHYPVTGLWATSGAFGVVVGLALQNVILDVFIGLAINFDKPFQLGHYVVLPQADLQGRVIEINWRTIRLLTDEDSIVVVPNRRIGDMVVTNMSVPSPASEITVTLSLDHSVPVERARRVLLAGIKAAAGANGIFESPKPRARVKGISAFGVDYVVLFHYEAGKVTPGHARDAAYRSILDQMQHAGLTPAYPKQDVFHAALPGRLLDTRSIDDRMEILHRIGLFASLQPEDLRELATHMKERSFSEGDRLLRQGDSGESMFILLEGLLDVFIGETPEKLTRVGQLSGGQFFGEMSLLTGELRSATIVAATDVLAYEITKAEMEALFARRPETIETISHTVTERRLRNEASRASEERGQHADTLRKQLVAKVRAFFGGARRPTGT